jgi:hypothetical protein
MQRLDYPVMHPGPLPSCRHDSSAAQVSQVSANFWLTTSYNLYKEADTHLIVTNQIQQTQTRLVGQSAKEEFKVKRFVRFAHNTRILT